MIDRTAKKKLVEAVRFFINYREQLTDETRSNLLGLFDELLCSIKQDTNQFTSQSEIGFTLRKIQQYLNLL